VINHADLVTAIQRVNFGISRSQKVSVKELLEVCYHEAGHTIVSYFRDRRERIQVVTIIPTGHALGYMWSVSKEDSFYTVANKQDLLSDIEVSLGGYCAENLHKDTTSSGVSSDLQNVGRVASDMIRQFGMGSFIFNTFSAYGARERRGSDATEREIEMEIKKVVDDCVDNVKKLLLAKRPELDRIAMGLYEKETLYYKDLVHILDPHRSDADIDNEIATMSERKLVGKAPVININMIPGLPAKGALGNGKKGSKNGKNGGNTGAGAGSESGSGDSSLNMAPPETGSESNN